MKKEPVLTFEEVNAHVEKHFTNEVAASLVAFPNVCGTYKTVRPILVLVTQTFFLPGSWNSAVKVLVAALDLMCPDH